MIKLDVEGYCQDCLDFDPAVVKATRIQCHNGEFEYSDTLIQCENRRRCAAIARHISQQKAKEDA